MVRSESSSRLWIDGLGDPLTLVGGVYSQVNKHRKRTSVHPESGIMTTSMCAAGRGNGHARQALFTI